jgi:hypothetical protein
MFGSVEVLLQVIEKLLAAVVAVGHPQRREQHLPAQVRIAPVQLVQVDLPRLRLLAQQVVRIRQPAPRFT